VGAGVVEVTDTTSTFYGGRLDLGYRWRRWGSRRHADIHFDAAYRTSI
jgi:hypothetical protein